MATPVIMPRQGNTVESCIISNWAKKVGDAVNVGDILFTYETDKATFDEEAKVAGTMLAVFFEEGDDVPCLTNVCVIGNAGEDFKSFAPEGAKEEASAPAPAVQAEPAKPAASVPAAAPVKSAPKSNAHPVIMPRQGNTVESCIISNWAKKVGDPVKTGDILFTYETDKATFDEESKFDGTMLAIFFEEGDDVPCLTNVCVIGQPGEGFEEFNPNAAASPEAPAAEAVSDSAAISEPTAAPAAATGAAKAVSADGRIAISPRAKNLAARTGVNPAFVAGSGPYGRIMEKDVKEFTAAGAGATFAAAAAAQPGMTGTGIGGKISLADLNKTPAAAEAAPAPKAAPAAEEADYEEVKLPNIRKVIAKSMHQSLSTMAQLTLNSSFDATQIMAYRKQLKENKEKLGLANITINDIILYAVSRTILAHRDCNAHYLDDTMRYFNNVHLGIAVDTPRGLLVPTLRNANKKSLNEISAEAKALATAAQSGTISPDALSGASFTITNLGTMGIESFTPVINPPQTAILGVNTLETRVKNVGGEMKMYQAMALSLTFDHRALDGAPAAKFLQELCKNLENFTLLLAK